MPVGSYFLQVSPGSDRLVSVTLTVGPPIDSAGPTYAHVCWDIVSMNPLKTVCWVSVLIFKPHLIRLRSAHMPATDHFKAVIRVIAPYTSFLLYCS